MATISLSVDEDLNAALESLCAARGLDKASVVTDLVRRFVDRDRLDRALRDPSLTALYRELEAEDVALAEEGLDGYRRLLTEADRR